MRIYLNGKWVDEKKAVVSVYDHGFLYGDGVYETLRVYKGRPFMLEAHLKRLKNSMDGIRLRYRLSMSQIGRAVERTIQINHLKEAVVRLTMTRGPGPYGFDPRPCHSPTLVITAVPLKPYPPELYKKGATVALVSVRRNSFLSQPPWIKATSCMNGILAKMESIDRGAAEGLMLDQAGFLTEGTVCNVFLVKKGTVYTPMLDGQLLPGVTRQYVCALARKAGYRVVEKNLPAASLFSADEAFLTSTIMEIIPITRVKVPGKGTPIRFGPYSEGKMDVGPVALDLMSRFKASL